MRKLLLCLLLLWIPTKLWANQAARGWCESGQQNVITSGLTSTTQVQASYPSCTVTVYNVVGGGLATIYADNSNTPLSNPFQAATNGQWQFYAANGRYTVTMTFSQPGAPTTVSYLDIQLYDVATTSPPIDPTNPIYGAKCDGATDDSVALQSAITAAISTRIPIQLPANKICVFATGLTATGGFTMNGPYKVGSGAAVAPNLKYTGSGIALNINNGTSLVYNVNLNNFYLLNANNSTGGIACTYCNTVFTSGVQVGGANLGTIQTALDFSNSAGIDARSMQEFNAVNGIKLINSTNVDIDACSVAGNTVSFLMGGSTPGQSGIDIHDCLNIEGQDYVLDWDDANPSAATTIANNIQFQRNFVIFDGGSATYPHQQLLHVSSTGTNYLTIYNMVISGNTVACAVGGLLCGSTYAMNVAISGTTNASTNVAMTASENKFSNFSAGGITSNGTTHANVAWLNNFSDSPADTNGTANFCVQKFANAQFDTCPTIIGNATQAAQPSLLPVLPKLLETLQASSTSYLNQPDVYISRIDTASNSGCLSGLIDACSAPVQRIDVTAANTGTTDTPIGLLVNIWGAQGLTPNGQNGGMQVGIGSIWFDKVGETGNTDARGANFNMQVQGVPSGLDRAGFTRSVFSVESDITNSAGADALYISNSGSGNFIGSYSAVAVGANNSTVGYSALSSASAAKGFLTDYYASGFTQCGFCTWQGNSAAEVVSFQSGSSGTYGFVAGAQSVNNANHNATDLASAPTVGFLADSATSAANTSSVPLVFRGFLADTAHINEYKLNYRNANNALWFSFGSNCTTFPCPSYTDTVLMDSTGSIETKGAFILTGSLGSSNYGALSAPGGGYTGTRTSIMPDGTGGIPVPAALVTTSGTSDNVAMQGVTASSHCSVTATNASAATNIATTYVSAKIANQITITHTTTANMNYDILCTPN